MEAPTPMTFDEVLADIRRTSHSESNKGTQFEELIQRWLLADPVYSSQLKQVWMWSDFPSKDALGRTDLGIDLVGQTHEGEYWAIQCKCYDEHTTISKEVVDSFISTSARHFTVSDDGTQTMRSFAQRLWISTTTQWGANAQETLRNQSIPVTCIGPTTLRESAVDWGALYQGDLNQARPHVRKSLRPHQQAALDKAKTHYATYDRGQLIMACGTGKTFTSLQLVEQQLSPGVDESGTPLPARGLVLFLVPSIALLGQTLRAWATDAQKPLRTICVCSDSQVTQKAKKKNAKRLETDENQDALLDLGLPASTDVEQVLKQLRTCRNSNGLVVLFSTYQSIDVVYEAQQKILQETGEQYGTFDFIICDEAHRTTGSQLVSQQKTSHFNLIHDEGYIHGRKRLYMTATPRLYNIDWKATAETKKSSGRTKARHKGREIYIWTMDDERTFGKEFYRMNFSQAVQAGILTDYKVLVLNLAEAALPEEYRNLIKQGRTETESQETESQEGETVGEYTADDLARLIGVISGLSKRMLGQELDFDTQPMRRALAFTSLIGNTSKPGSSKYIADKLPELSTWYQGQTDIPEDKKNLFVQVDARHIDGSMGAEERSEILRWLEDEIEPGQCRVVSNVRCLSEGVDVPALDAVIFLSGRSSQVDIVQSVGRVMRSFHRGLDDEKKFGYIIIPVLIPDDQAPELVLQNHEVYKTVWDVLNALRSHDDHFNVEVNSIQLNNKKDNKILFGVPDIPHSQAIATEILEEQSEENIVKLDQYIAQHLPLMYGNEAYLQFYAKLVEKCGDRLYWDSWGKRVGEYAKKYIGRIERIIEVPGSEAAKLFNEFHETIKNTLNSGIRREDCIEMLAQHMITGPIFNTLFGEYKFAQNNSISSSMQLMIELLEQERVNRENETDETLQKFFDSIKTQVGHIDNSHGKQQLIKTLYDQFFKSAFPHTVEKLGIVFTPVECVDFILRSVDHLLHTEFHSSLSDEGVHILDPFTGTGTFITRLLQLGLIQSKDLERKYREEIHANELILLAYYVADVNIETVFHEVSGRGEYLPFDGICLTDTFQMGEEGTDDDLFGRFFEENSQAVKKQRNTPIRVIVGNPPYSIGQKSANDNAANQYYPKLQKHIQETYAARSAAKNKSRIHDSYIKAFRWATDRLDPQQPGIVAFISNGAWLDSVSADGFRASLALDFDKIYVYNLRGDAHTSGEQRKKEGGGIFGAGCRTPIAITCLVRYPEEQRTGKCEIYYHDIGDYLKTEEKLARIREAVSLQTLPWQRITPNQQQDWLRQRGDLFGTLLPLATDERGYDQKAQAFFAARTPGIGTNRDAWVYGYSREQLKERMQRMIDCYHEQIGREEPTRDKTQIAWSSSLEQRGRRGERYAFDPSTRVVAAYRPFCKQHLYYHRPFIERPGQFPSLFPEEAENLVITTDGTGAKGDFSCLITDRHTDLQLMKNALCYPLYWYEERVALPTEDLFGASVSDRWVRRDAISDWIHEEAKRRYPHRGVTKEDLFYYVYGLLHSPDYRTRFADHLGKEAARLPLVESWEDFAALSRAGRALAALHLHYEDYPAPKGVTVQYDYAEPQDDPEELYSYYRVEKMRTPKRADKTPQTLQYNAHITITGIPAAAYEYRVNGRSPIEWVIERYQIKTDKDSLIKNDPNDWCREQGNPRYILDLLLSLIHVSIETQSIVAKLPRLDFPDATAPTSDPQPEEE